MRQPEILDPNLPVIVTGAAGYIGSYFCAFLINAGVSTAALLRRDDGYDRMEQLPALRSCLDHLDILEHDGSAASMGDAMAAYGDAVVVHLAGRFVSNHAPNDVDALCDANVGFACRVFEAMRVGGLKRIVNVGTLWEFGPHCEQAPANLYAALKAANDNVLDFYATAFGFSAVSLKLLDTYGRDDPRPKLLPLLKRIAREGGSLDMTAGQQRINLCHVDDICCALAACAAMTADRPGRWTVCALTPWEPTVREIVDYIEMLMGGKLDVRWGARPDGPQQRAICRDLPLPDDWKPHIDLQTGLTEYMKE